MGSKQTKIEGSFSPGTPMTQRASSPFIKTNADNNSLEPRSPAEYRTPIYLQNKRVGPNLRFNSVDMPERDSNNQNTIEFLRKRFFKSFSYNLYDPRSPSLNFNRTPLVFEDTLEKSLCLDDTFADLFVESRIPVTCNKLEQSEEKTDTKVKQDSDIKMAEEKVIIDLKEPMTSPKTHLVLQQKFDPRSPSIGVERTPIILADDEVYETNEDIMLENILETLSLNLNTSGNSSVSSITPQKVNINLNDKIDPQLLHKPMNKHLERARVGKKNSSKAKHRKLKMRPSHQQIYEDQENHILITPKLKASQADKNDSLKCKRTPLSCVRNRNGTQMRSRSAESSAKSHKTRLTDESQKDPNLCIMQQNKQDSLEL